MREGTIGDSFTQFAEGAFRRAYSFNSDRCVLKVQKYGREEDNKQEVTDYMKAHSDPDFKGIRPFILPIVAHAHDYKWLVTPKARTTQTDHLTGREMDGVVKSLEKKFKKAEVCCTDVLDHRNNMGKLEGKPIVIDYGFGFYCTKPKNNSCPIGTRRG